MTAAQDIHIDLMHVLYVHSRVMGGGGGGGGGVITKYSRGAGTCMQGRRKQLAFGTAECSSVPTVLYNVLSPSNNVMESHMYEMSICMDVHNAIIYI